MKIFSILALTLALASCAGDEATGKKCDSFCRTRCDAPAQGAACPEQSCIFDCYNQTCHMTPEEVGYFWYCPM